jgi:hypothetical protein
MKIGLMIIGGILVFALLLYGVFKAIEFFQRVKPEDPNFKYRDGYTGIGTELPFDIPKPANDNEPNHKQK